MGEDVVQAGEADTVCGGIGGIGVGIVGDDGHADTLRQFGKAFADVAEADDAEGFAAELATDNAVPATAGDAGVSLRDVAGEGVEQANGEFGDGIGVGRRGVADGQAVRGTGGDVDIVHADAVFEHGFEMWRAGEDSLVHGR